jgi:hypothetical protein
VTEPINEQMTEERAREVVATVHETRIPAGFLDEFVERLTALCGKYLMAKGYLERLEQEKEVLEAADGLYDTLKEDDYPDGYPTLEDYRAARAKLDKGQ